MITDLNKGISEIKYNYLNLPTEISWTGSSNKIRYVYNAAGQKVKKTVVDGTTTKIVDYLDGFQYAGEVLQFFPHPEGYVKATPGAASINSPPTSYSYNYVYNYTDHLGNVRLSYSKNPVTNQLNILEENHYYPFGLKHEVYISGGKRDYRAIPDDNDPRLIGVTTTDYNYKYNGKEFQDELGLNMYDMDMRQYDPTIARWVVMDPIVHFDFSPYNAFDNNPVFWADPSGADGEHYNWDRNRFEDSQGREVTYEAAMASQGLNPNGTEKGSPSSNTETTTTITETFKPTTTSGNLGDDKIHFHEEKLIRTVYLENGFAIERSVKFVTIYEVIIDSDGDVASIYYTQYTYLNGKSNDTKSKYLDVKDSDIPQAVIGKMNSIINYKRKFGESPRQTEAFINSGENKNLKYISTGLTAAGRYLSKTSPAGKVAGGVAYSIAGGLWVYTTIINSDNANNIKVISTSYEKKRNN